MTDLETLRAVMGACPGVVDVQEGARESCVLHHGEKHWPTVVHEMRVDADGYSGFFIVFGFDADGHLAEMGAWE